VRERNCEGEHLSFINLRIEVERELVCARAPFILVGERERAWAA
jgi:hypothetical protein